MKILKLSIIFFLLFFASQVPGQDSLNKKYIDIIESTETFNQYKVIPRSTIDAFWGEVVDSLQENSQKIIKLADQVRIQADSIRALATKKNTIQNQLEESLTLNDSISFIGLSLSKMAYHFVVWSIIIILAVLAFVCYFMFLKSNRVTTRSRKELETLQLAFEEHKNQSREKQVRLKRELQTAVNTMEDMKRGRG